jgi:hypothetical protein
LLCKNCLLSCCLSLVALLLLLFVGIIYCVLRKYFILDGHCRYASVLNIHMLMYCCPCCPIPLFIWWENLLKDGVTFWNLLNADLCLTFCWVPSMVVQLLKLLALCFFPEFFIKIIDVCLMFNINVNNCSQCKVNLFFFLWKCSSRMLNLILADIWTIINQHFYVSIFIKEFLTYPRCLSNLGNLFLINPAICEYCIN